MVLIDESSGDKKPLIGQVLIQRKVITEEQLKKALQLQRKEKSYIGEILIKLGYLEEKDVVAALVLQCSIPYIAVNKYNIDKKILELIPREMAKELYIIPLDLVGKVLSVVMVDPLNEEIKNKITQKTGCQIASFIATKAEIEDAILKSYNK